MLVRGGCLLRRPEAVSNGDKGELVELDAILEILRAGDMGAPDGIIVHDANYAKNGIANLLEEWFLNTN